MERLASIAESMLDAGVLKSRDWTGDLSQSVIQGMGRYASKYVWKQLAIRFFVADNVANTQCPYPGCDWHSYVGEVENSSFYKPRETPQWGMVALVHNPYEDWPHVVIGERCQQLETFVKGAGTTLVNLITLALSNTIGGFTPLSAYYWWSMEYLHRVEWVQELEAEQESEDTDPEGALSDSMNAFIYEEEKLNGYPDPEAFRELFPPGLFRKRIARCLLRRAEQTLPVDAPLVLHEALRHGVDLLKAFDNLRAFRKQNEAFVTKYEPQLIADQVLPIGVLWEEQDAVGRMSDEYLEHLNGTEATEVCFGICFDPADPASIVLAFQEADLVLRVLRPLDKVLHYLNGFVPRDEKPHDIPLMHVLAELEDLPDDDAPMIVAF